jgi:hypothetical protein
MVLLLAEGRTDGKQSMLSSAYSALMGGSFGNFGGAPSMGGTSGMQVPTKPYNAPVDVNTQIYP